MSQGGQELERTLFDPVHVHLAVIEPRYARAMLSGRKTIESRLSRSRAVPFGRVRAGERVYFLARKAGLIVTAVVEQVTSHEGLDAAGIDRLRATFGDAIAADESYWEQKRAARYATLLRLRDVERVTVAPDDVYGRARSYRSGWVIRPAWQCVYAAARKDAKASA